MHRPGAGGSLERMEPTTDQATTRITGDPTERAAEIGPAPIDPAFDTPSASYSTQAPAMSTETRPKFRLRRSRTDRMLGGVCGGLAESLGVDAALVRIGLVTLTVLGFGMGIVLYAAVWVLAPETDEP
jgi:phage shock protein C